MIIVNVNNVERKQEYTQLDEGFDTHLRAVLKVFDIQGDITGISYDGGYKYGVYMRGLPTVSPISLDNIETDPLTNNLVSFKVDLESSTVRAKVYYIGNTTGLEFPRDIACTGVYIGEDVFTVYYPTEGSIPSTDVFRALTLRGFSAKTVYSDGTISDESKYTQSSANYLEAS